MKHSQKQRTQPKQPAFQSGRRVAKPPDPTHWDRLACKVQRREEHRKREAEAKAERHRQEEQRRLDRYRKNVHASAEAFADGAGLDGTARRRLVNTVLNRFDSHARVWDPTSFKWLEIAQRAKHRIAGGVAPPSVAAKQAKAAAALPPSPANSIGARLPPGADPKAYQRKLEADERAKKAHDQKQSDDEAVRAVLKKHGLSDWRHPIPGNSMTGLGY
jgi:hypothetical protein